MRAPQVSMLPPKYGEQIAAREHLVAHHDGAEQKDDALYQYDPPGQSHFSSHFALWRLIARSVSTGAKSSVSGF